MKEEKSVREMLAEFDALVAEFDREDLDVEQATEKFAKASNLAKKIREKLNAEELKITEVRENFAKDFGENDA